MQIVVLAKAGEPETRTVFYFAVGCVVGGAGWMLVGGLSPWSWSAAVWLLPIGIGAIIASGIAATVIRMRAAPATPGEEH